MCAILLGSLALLAGTAFAAQESPVPRLQQEARRLQLGQAREWLQLGHYKAEGNGWRSQVDDERFFLADAAGVTDPQAELAATLAALYAETDAPSGDDQHPYCRFPARREWLSRHLPGGLPDLPVRNCKAYAAWRPLIPDGRLTLIFPTYQLNSPSSMFGHTLLRLDPTDLPGKSEWLSVAVNFGAQTSADDNSLFYALKGLGGGYPGFFIVSRYYEKIREYSTEENRDIWEYPLNLTPDEIRRMVLHLWELNGTRFDYFFFDENCAYRLLELLEAARPSVDLTGAFGASVIPIDTVRSIQRAGLIDGVVYRASQGTQLDAAVAAIPGDLQYWIKALAEQPALAETPGFQALPAVQQRQLADTAYRYLRKAQGDGPRDPEVAQRSYRLLTLLNRYPTAESAPVRQGDAPESGHFSRRLRLAGGQADGRGYADLGLRLSFHGIEDNPQGFLQGAQINLGNFELRASDGQPVRLQRADIVDIVSLSPRNALFSPLSWYVMTGWESLPGRNADDTPMLVAHLTGGGGVAYSTAAQQQAYCLLGGRLENNRDAASLLTSGIGIRCGHVHQGSAGNGHLQLSAFALSNQERRQNVSYQLNLPLDRQHALRLHLQRASRDEYWGTEAGLAFLAYF